VMKVPLHAPHGVLEHVAHLAALQMPKPQPGVPAPSTA
jgi:hypothetical protein